MMDGIEHTDIVVLAGGLGTRLRPVIEDRPKILAPIGDRPFLDHLLHYLRSQGARRVILALGYRADQVEAHLRHAGSIWADLDIELTVEPEPLGTGGGLMHASALLESDPFLVMNGDTFVGADLNDFVRTAGTSAAALLALKVENASRYGRLALDAADRVVRFEEKGAAAGPAWINGGIYRLHADTLAPLRALTKSSIERDLLEALPPGTLQAVRSEARFVDIGTPESWREAPSIIAAALRDLDHSNLSENS